MRSFARTVLLGILLTAPAVAEEAAATLPWATSAVDVESGMLWEVGSNTPIPYRLVPTQLVWRSGKFIGHVFANESRFVLRHRFTLLGTWVENGPESHYVGISGSPSLEWWDRTGRWSVFTGAGGGFGLIDSRGVTGGQGQDFTLNWFIRSGVEHVTARNVRYSAGLMFQHMSNGGKTDPNPGIDALGFTLGGSWAF